MSELLETLRSEFQDEDYRRFYAEECLNTMIATQIKVLREQRNMTQSALAERAGMLQPRLSVMEDANYSRWSLTTLKRLAKAFDLALSVRFESFSEVVMDFEELSRESLARPSFADDPIFSTSKARTHRTFHRRQDPEVERDALQGRRTQVLPDSTAAYTWTSASNVDEAQTLYFSAQEGGITNAACIGASR